MKKIIVLSCVIAFAAAVFAEDLTVLTVGPGETYTTFTAAVAAAQTGQETKIVLSGTPSDTNGKVYIESGKSITLDLNDQTLKCQIVSSNDFTIVDSGPTGKGMLQISKGSAVTMANGATFTLESGSISGSDGGSLVQTTANYNVAETLVINGGKITYLNNNQNCVLAWPGDILIINGGTIGDSSSGNGVNCQGRGEITASKGPVVLGCGSNTDTVNRYALSVGKDANFVVFGTNVVVNGPMFKENSGKISILNGTYSTDPSNYVPVGWKTVMTDEAWSVSMKQPLQEDEKLMFVTASNMGSLYESYATLQAAVQAAGTGKTRIMLMAVPEDNNNTISIGSDKNIRLDLHGQTIYCTINNQGDFTILDSGVTGMLRPSSGSAVVNLGGAKFTLESGTISGLGNNFSIVQSTKDNFVDNIVINGGTITNTVDKQNCILNTEGDRLIVNGGTIGNKTSGNGVNNQSDCEITGSKGLVVLDCSNENKERSALSSTIAKGAVTMVTGTNVVVKGALSIKDGGKIILSGGTYHAANPSTVATIADGYMVEGSGPWVVRKKPTGTLIIVK